MTGMKFGRLLVVSRFLDADNKWACRCECGRFVDVTGSKLRCGAQKSCGCLERETVQVRYFDAGSHQVWVYQHCIVSRPGEKDGWMPDRNDSDTSALLWQVAVGECLAGILADRLEERYNLVELANLLRKGSGVGGG